MWRLMPFLFLLYIVAYLDRINMSFAVLQMRGQLGLSERAIGRAGRRLALAATAAAAVVASALTAATGASGWVTAGFGVGAAVFAVWLAADLFRD